MRYIRLAKGGVHNYKLVPDDGDIYKHVENFDSEYYTSIFKYSQDHYDRWVRTGSVAGIKDTTTNLLLFDLDSKSNPDIAREDAITVISRLVAAGFNEKDINVAFSGSKGFHVWVDTNETFTPTEFKTVVSSIAGDLESFDRVVSDSNRLIRLAGTKHSKTGLYKIPLSTDQLKTDTMDQIRKTASSNDVEAEFSIGVSVPQVISALKSPKKEKDTVDLGLVAELDLKKKPKFLDTPRWYLQNGFFGSGERNNAFLCLAATYKNLGFEKEHTYRLLKGVAEIQAKRNNMDRFADVELWKNIIEVVYSEFWGGGQFSSKDENSWLYHYCKKYNIEVSSEDKPLTMVELGGDSFTRYAKSFYETRIYTGLDSLDAAFPICAGSNVAIVGAASSGKTALSLNILKKMKDNGGISVFASLDMSKSRLYEKMLYSVTGGKVSRDQLYQDYLGGKGGKYDELVKEAFPNTYIFSKSAPTVDNMRDYIEKVQDHTGKPVRLLLTDYFERVGSERSDETAASKDVASGIQDLIADFPELTPITLYQPNKFSLGGGPDSPILSYTAIKGSSFIFQAARQIVSLWRPFFTPETKHLDKYMSMAILKNDLGELDKFDFSWEGKTGRITEMDDMQREEFVELMKEKERKKGVGDLI